MWLQRNGNLNKRKRKSILRAATVSFVRRRSFRICLSAVFNNVEYKCFEYGALFPSMYGFHKQRHQITIFPLFHSNNKIFFLIAISIRLRSDLINSQALDEFVVFEVECIVKPFFRLDATLAVSFNTFWSFDCQNKYIHFV